MRTALVTGADGFTGKHLVALLEANGFHVIRSQFDLSDGELVRVEIKKLSTQKSIDWVIHLAAISFVGHADNLAFYDVNVLGTEYLLQALAALKQKPKVILASSANVYGSPESVSLIDERVCPSPVNHYACSKLSMEYIARQYMQQLQIVITRPFNYTGVGQSEQFVIPKIVSHFKQGLTTIELGNINVSRDFSAVEDVVESYWQIMNADINDTRGQVVNVCSGKAISLHQIINMLESISGYSIEVLVNPQYVRPNEIKSLCGSNQKLFDLTGFKPADDSLQKTLLKMFQA